MEHVLNNKISSIVKTYKKIYEEVRVISLFRDTYKQCIKRVLK